MLLGGPNGMKHPEKVLCIKEMRNTLRILAGISEWRQEVTSETAIN
jgi:hypothetical protein